MGDPLKSSFNFSVTADKRTRDFTRDHRDLAILFCNSLNSFRTFI